MTLQGDKPQPQISLFFLRTHSRDRQPQKPLESEFQPQKIKRGAFPYSIEFAFPRQEIDLLLGDERPCPQADELTIAPCPVPITRLAGPRSRRDFTQNAGNTAP